MVYYKALSLLSDVFGAGVNRNEFGHNECFTQTMLFRYNHCVLSLWIQLNIQILRNVHTYIHTYIHLFVLRNLFPKMKGMLDEKTRQNTQMEKEIKAVKIAQCM